MFNIGRIPTPHCDILSSPPAATSSDGLNLLLMIHGWCYTIPVYHRSNAPNQIPQLKKPHEIESQIQAVVLDVEQRLASGETAIPIGTLSADDRDKWAAVCFHFIIHGNRRKLT